MSIRTAFFGLCFVIVTVFSFMLATLMDAAMVSPVAYPPFMAGVLGMVMSAAGFFYSWVEDRN